MSKKAAEQFPILLVDDEVEILFSTSFLFQSEGFANVTTENDSRRVMEVLNRQDVSLIILDLNMPYLSGFELLKIIAETDIRPAAIIGVPVGFVGAAESKELLAATSPVPYITVAGTKGGSPIAAAAVNAIIYLQD